MYVVDASVYAPLMVLLGGKMRRTMVRGRFHILDLTIYEVCNAFWKEYSKLGRIDRELAVESCSLSAKLAKYAVVHSVCELDMERVARVAAEAGIPVYDAAYIELANMLGKPLASHDKDILETAPRYGIETLDLDMFLKVVEELSGSKDKNKVFGGDG